MVEQWKEIYPDYLVSTLGNVDSLKRGKRHRLSLHVQNNGYLKVGLSINNQQKFFGVHRLVAMAFIPNPEGKPEVNHINGIKTDNRVENLEWATRLENQIHAYTTGLHVAGQNEDAPRAKLTNEQVRYIRDNPDGLTIQQMAKKFGVVHTTISEIQRGLKYKGAGGKIRNRIDTRIPDEIRAKIREEYKPKKRGYGSTILARKYGLGRTTIKQIIQEND